MTNSKDKGDLSTVMVLASLMKAGKVVLLPYGDNQRYDLVVDEDGNFIRIQCKTGRLEKRKTDCITFSTASTYAHRGGKRRHYRGQIDFFGVYCPVTDKVYFVPVDEVGLCAGYLRLVPVKNSQRKGVRYASDYETFQSSSKVEQRPVKAIDGGASPPAGAILLVNPSVA